MRRALVTACVLGLLELASGCDSKFGAYLNIDGDANQIRFDHVQLYFGTTTSRTVIAKPSGPAMGTVFDRQFEVSDVFDVPKNGDGTQATETSYWLPPTETNKSMSYVAAVASKDGKAVGVGEILQLSVEDGVVFKYDIELQPFTTAEEWGENPSCLAWAHQRESGFSTVAVVHPDDQDCDGQVATVDCNDHCPPGGTGCMNRGICSPPGGTCGFGCATSLACTTEVCAPPDVCNPICANAGSIDKRLECALDRTPEHIELTLYTEGTNGPLCQNQFTFDPYGIPCTAPIIEWVDPRMPDDFQYSISESQGKCDLKVVSPTNAPFVVGRHIFVSIAPPSGSGPRPTFTVGVAPGLPSCGTTGDLYTFQPSGMPNICQ